MAVCRKLQKQLQKLEKEEHAEDRLLKEEVDEDDIARSRQHLDGDPCEPPYGRRKKKLAHLDEILPSAGHRSDEAVKAVSEAVIARSCWYQRSQQATGSFIFLGLNGRRQDGTCQETCRSALQR